MMAGGRKKMEISMPKIKFLGFPKKSWAYNHYTVGQYLEKVAIDWGKRKIRGSLYDNPEHEFSKIYPNSSGKPKKSVLWFSFDDIGTILEIESAPNNVGVSEWK